MLGPLGCAEPGSGDGLRAAGAMVGAMLVGSGNVVKNGINSSMGQVFGSTVIATTFGVTGAMLTCLLLEGLGAGRSRETAPWREAGLCGARAFWLERRRRRTSC